MDCVNGFVKHARKRVILLDYVAKCCQLCGEPREAVDTLLADLHKTSLRDHFYELRPALAETGHAGALPTAYAQSIWIDTDRAADGLVIDRDWRAWLVPSTPGEGGYTARKHIVELIDELERLVQPTPELAQPALPALSETAQAVLRALLNENATSEAASIKKKMLQKRVAALVSIDTERDDPLRAPLAALRKTSADPCIGSVPGGNGGVFLTAYGLSVAQRLADSEGLR
jgi:hypothetical protein